jgi:hypothetical protein
MESIDDIKALVERRDTIDHGIALEYDEETIIIVGGGLRLSHRS